MADIKTRGFNVFAINDEVVFNRLGKKVIAKCRDGSFSESDSVESNLLYEILKVMKKK